MHFNHALCTVSDSPCLMQSACMWQHLTSLGLPEQRLQPAADNKTPQKPNRLSVQVPRASDTEPMPPLNSNIDIR